MMAIGPTDVRVQCARGVKWELATAGVYVNQLYTVDWFADSDSVISVEWRPIDVHWCSDQKRRAIEALVQARVYPDSIATVVK